MEGLGAHKKGRQDYHHPDSLLPVLFLYSRLTGIFITLFPPLATFGIYTKTPGVSNKFYKVFSKRQQFQPKN